jgi:outer membrane protein OmpA-like peptidoglycan-associated protein
VSVIQHFDWERNVVSWLKALGFVISTVVLTFVTGCQTAPPAPPEIRFHRDAASAIDFLSKALAQQLAPMSKPTNFIPVEEFVSVQSAEIPVSGRTLQAQLIEALGKTMAPAKFAPLTGASATGAQWALLANYATPRPDERLAQSGNWVRLQVAMVQSSTGKVLTRITTYLDASQFNAEPTQFYKDAPMYLTDARHRQRVGAMDTQTPQSLEGLLLAQSALNEAIAAYEAGKYDEAERGFTKVRAMATDHRGALSGLYQTFWKTQRRADAEQAFDSLIGTSLDADSIAVKLLFRLGSASFVDTADLANQYRVWLKSIGQVSASKNRCLDVIGHASKSGTAELNDRLSLQRAESVVATIAQTSNDARNRFKASGRGFQETIVGTGANDATDAIDRRVEFKVRSCT